MKLPQKYKTLLSNTGLLFIGTFGSKMISFIMLPFYTSWLSIEDFGTSDVINVYSTILVSIVSLCIAEAVFVIPTGRNKEDQRHFFSSSLLFAMLCTITLLVLYVVVALFKGESTASYVSNIGYITLLSATTIYMSIAQQFCKCINKIKVYAIAGLINTLCVALLGFVLIKTFGLLGYIMSLVIANVVALVYVFIRARLRIFVSLSAVSWQHLKEMLKYSIPLIPNSIIWLIVNYVNRPIMETSMGMAAIGLFSLANRFPTLITTVYNNFSNAWQISVLQEYGKDSYENFYNRICVIVFVGLCICVSIISIVIGPIIHLLFNENYYSAIDYIPFLCLSTPFVALSSIVGANFTATKQSKYFFYSSIWAAGSAVLCNSILIPILGLWGACVSCIISFLVGAIVRIIYSRKIVRLKWGYIYISISLLTILTLFVPFNSFTLLIVLIEIVICYFLYKNKY